jgi:hypothetical protein
MSKPMIRVGVIRPLRRRRTGLQAFLTLVGSLTLAFLATLIVRGLIP